MVVTVTGPESTGKTTLARQLAEACGGEWSAEAARAYAAALADPRALGVEDVRPIALRQMALEDAAAERAAAAGRRLVVRDTDLLSTAVYARWAYGYEATWLDAAVLGRRAQHYLLCDVDLAWEPDPVRDPSLTTRESWARQLDAFVDALGRYGCSWSWVRGAGDARTAGALRAVRRLGACA